MRVDGLRRRLLVGRVSCPTRHRQVDRLVGARVLRPRLCATDQALEAVLAVFHVVRKGDETLDGADHGILLYSEMTRGREAQQ